MHDGNTPARNENVSECLPPISGRDALGAASVLEEETCGLKSILQRRTRDECHVFGDMDDDRYSRWWCWFRSESSNPSRMTSKSRLYAVVVYDAVDPC